MYKFPSNFDPGLFGGHTLEMICLNANQTYLHFDGDVTICAESTFFHERINGNLSATVPVPTLHSNLMGLIEHQVSTARVENGDMLILIFDDGQVLRFEALPEFESYRVTIGENTIII